MSRHFFSSFLVAILLFLSSCSKNTSYIAISGYAQGGVYTVKINLEGINGKPLTKEPIQIKEDIDSILNVIDFTLSGYNKGSLLSKFNAGETIIPNKMFEDIYALSYSIFRETEGAFDVAAGPLFDAWGFGFTTDSLPSTEKVKELMATCGMGRLKDHIEPNADGTFSPTDLLNEGETVLPKLNFNAIAQGYSCDVVSDYLHSIGVKDMLVDIGEIRCEGLNPNNGPWTISVDRPFDGNENPGENIDGVWQSNGSDQGIVTSGNYRKFYIKDGHKFAHTIDPRSGSPVEHSLLSATIVAKDGATADAYATYCMVIGLEEAQAFINSRSDLEGYLIYDDGTGMKEWASSGFNLVD